MADPQAPAHWCYLCSSQVVAQPGDSLTCPLCGDGFLEVLDTARNLSDVRRSLRRNRRPPHRRLPRHHPHDPSPQQVLRLLRFLARSTGNAPASRSPDAQTSSRSHSPGQDSNDPANPSSSLASSSPRGNVSEGQIEAEVSSRSERNVTAELGEGTDDGSILFIRDGSLLDEEDDLSDSDAEVGILELSDWDSLGEDEEDEWEEAGGDEADLVVNSLETPDERLEVSMNSEQEDVEDGQVDELRQTNPTNNRPRFVSLFHRNLHRQFRNLERQSVEAQLDLPDFDTYVTNPADYLDARGFDELIQQLIDTDNSRRGPPPAAKSAVESLPSVVIQQENVKDGSALCAICKDVLALDEPAKQLPCLHLYHSICILPWLSSRNSCPVCRYELPTDDPDYEEQKNNRSSHEATRGSLEAGESNLDFTLSQEDGGESSNTGASSNNDSHSSQPDELVLETIKEEIEAASEQGEISQPNETSSEGNVKGSSDRNSFLEAIAGPLINIVGLVVVSCLGNFFLGNCIQKGRRLAIDTEVGKSKEVQGRKPWWMRLFG